MILKHQWSETSVYIDYPFPALTEYLAAWCWGTLVQEQEELAPGLSR